MLWQGKLRKAPELAGLGQFSPVLEAWWWADDQELAGLAGRGGVNVQNKEEQRFRPRGWSGARVIGCVVVKNNEEQLRRQGGPRTEDRRQKTEDEGRRTEGRGPEEPESLTRRREGAGESRANSSHRLHGCVWGAGVTDWRAKWLGIFMAGIV